MLKQNKNVFIFFSVFVSMSLFLAGLLVGPHIWKSIGIPFIARGGPWSIGIYAGTSPFELNDPTNLRNPVIKPNDISDVTAAFLADPFLIRYKGIFYMFFEVANIHNKKGEIGLAVSNNSYNWKYKKIILEESFHLSYPYVFKWENDFFMIPESHKSKTIRLYKATSFPDNWSFVKTLIDGEYDDPSILFYDNKWWLFATKHSDGCLYLFYSDKLMGPWLEHQKNPIIAHNKHKSRLGGRIIIFKNKIIRYAQDDDLYYGIGVNSYEITKLNTLVYEENELPKLKKLKASGSGWNSNGMHHIDPLQIDEGKWIASVDGQENKYIILGIKGIRPFILPFLK